MSQLVFPTLQGKTWNIIKTPQWNTIKSTAQSGMENRIKLWSYPKYQIDLEYSFLTTKLYSGSLTANDLENIISFYNSVGGSYDDFLYLDPQENSVSDQLIGVANNSATQFQLKRSVGTWSEPVFGYYNTPTIKVNGVTVSPDDYTLSDTGLVTFDTAPVSGNITWTGNYYFRCRFLEDKADFKQFAYNLYSCEQLSLITVKI